MYNISIITVCKDNLAELEETATSILAQTIDSSDFEWIIKDGQSSDGTISFVEKINDGEKNILFESSPDKNLYDAMNRGLELARGKYVLFLNAGDMLADDHVLEKLNRNIYESDTHDTFLLGDVIDILPDGRMMYKKTRRVNYLSHSLPTSHQSILYRKSDIISGGYSIRYAISSDYYLTAAMYARNFHGVSYLGFPVSRFKIGGLSTIYRKRVLLDCYRIQRDVLRLGLFFRLTSYVRRFIAMLVFGRNPTLYEFVRNTYYIIKDSVKSQISH